MSEEQWLPIPDHPRYEVSDFGNIRRRTPWRRDGVRQNLTPWLNKGYAHVAVKDDGRNKKLPIHRCVLLAFRGRPEFDDAQVCHLDGNRSNNHLSNLIWGTRKINASHRVGHGTQPRGEQSHLAKLRESDVLAIMERVAAGHFQKDIARDFGVSRSAISLIKSGQTWTHCKLTRGTRLEIK
jgi:hypothetical protein